MTSTRGTRPTPKDYVYAPACGAVTMASPTAAGRIERIEGEAADTGPRRHELATRDDREGAK